MEIHETTPEQGTGSQPSPVYDGSWETKGRSLPAAAVLGLLGIGVLYFNAQTILALLGILIAASASPGAEISGNFSERLVALIRLYAEPIRIALLVSQYLFMLYPTWWLVKKWHTRQVREYIRLRGCSAGEILLAVIATLAVIPFSEYLTSQLIRQLEIPEVLFKINAELFTAYSFPEFLWLVVVVAVTPGICEEIFFRGYAQRTFERTLKGKSVWIVGIVFGLYHMQPLGLLSLTLLGILFGYFYYRSQSLLPAMAAHFSNNFLVLWILYRSPQIRGVDLDYISPMPFSWALVTLPVALAALYLFHKLTARNNALTT